jgi:hypothetical protein
MRHDGIDYCHYTHWAQENMKGDVAVRATSDDKEVTTYHRERRKVMRTDYKITLRVDIDVEDNETKQVIADALRNAAQLLYTQALLVSGNRKPQIGLESNNSYEGTAEIELFNPDED